MTLRAQGAAGCGGLTCSRWARAHFSYLAHSRALLSGTWPAHVVVRVPGKLACALAAPGDVRTCESRPAAENRLVRRAIAHTARMPRPPDATRSAAMPSCFLPGDLLVGRARGDPAARDPGHRSSPVRVLADSPRLGPSREPRRAVGLDPVSRSVLGELAYARNSQRSAGATFWPRSRPRGMYRDAKQSLSRFT